MFGSSREVASLDVRIVLARLPTPFLAIRTHRQQLDSSDFS